MTEASVCSRSGCSRTVYNEHIYCCFPCSTDSGHSNRCYSEWTSRTATPPVTEQKINFILGGTRGPHTAAEKLAYLRENGINSRFYVDGTDPSFGPLEQGTSMHSLCAVLADSNVDHQKLFVKLLEVNDKVFIVLRNNKYLVDYLISTLSPESASGTEVTFLHPQTLDELDACVRSLLAGREFPFFGLDTERGVSPEGTATVSVSIFSGSAVLFVEVALFAPFARFRKIMEKLTTSGVVFIGNGLSNDVQHLAPLFRVRSHIDYVDFRIMSGKPAVSLKSVELFSKKYPVGSVAYSMYDAIVSFMLAHEMGALPEPLVLDEATFVRLSKRSSIVPLKGVVKTPFGLEVVETSPPVDWAALKERNHTTLTGMAADRDHDEGVLSFYKQALYFCNGDPSQLKSKCSSIDYANVNGTWAVEVTLGDLVESGSGPSKGKALSEALTHALARISTICNQ